MINKSILIGLGVTSMFGIALLSVLLYAVQIYNRSVGLENQFKASLENREALYDNMVKQITEKLGIAKYERATVVALIDNAVKGRDGGTLFKSVNEQYPQVSPAAFMEVMATISGKRDEFTRSQQTLMQLQKEFNDMRTQFPYSLIVGGKPELKFDIVSSDATKNIMKTGVDNSIITP